MAKGKRVENDDEHSFEIPDGAEIRVFPSLVEQKRRRREIDLIQPGDPRFKKYYPKQAEEMSRAKERANESANQAEEKKWRRDKKFKERFGREGQKVLDRVKEKHPSLD